MWKKGHMTFIFERDLAIIQINVHAENKDAASTNSGIIVLKDT